MKLNILGKSLLAAGLLAMVACSDDAPITAGSEPSNGSVSDGDGYYMTVNIQLPTAGSRSQTTDDGNSNADPNTEIGFEYENDVNDILIVLADAEDNSFITAGSVAGAKLNPVPAQNAYRPVAKLDKTSLGDFYQAYYQTHSENDNPAINVFVFCNPTKDLVNYINGLSQQQGKNTEWVNATCTVLEGNGQTPTNVGIWGQNGFLMSNKRICTRELPVGIDGWKKYNTEETAFNLSGVNNLNGDDIVDNSVKNSRGAIEVERNVARFDFRDGSTLGDNTYNVIYTLDADGKQIPLFNVQLDRMMLTNEAKEFYYLPRVSDKGQLANSILCGSEFYNSTTRDGNYVVGPYAATTNEEIYGQFSKYFNYPFFNSKSEVDFTQWTTSYLNDVIGKTADNLTNEQLKDEYYVWRYVTENVIPANNNNQTMGRTTMVVFKGRMVPAEAAFESKDENVKAIADAIGNGTTEHPCKLDENPNKNHAIYYFNNLAYFGWDNIKNSAIESALQFQTITVEVGDKTEDRIVPTYEEVEVEIDGKKETIKVLTGVRHSSSLYIAVFGDGCMGKIKWGTETYYDQPEGMSVDETSTNYLYDLYEVAKNDNNIDTDAALAAFKTAVTTQGITIYESSNDSQDGPGYYFYYYYKNRHNDNGDNGTMGTMEFATVRNNVYKLAVTNIKSLGHPRIPENDPDAPKPDTPDESDDLYITVSCRVLPWVVRINNIEF